MVGMLFILLFSYTIIVDGFLLDSPNQQGFTGPTGSNQQYVTVSDLLDAKKEQAKEAELLYHKIEQLSHNTDKTLNVLTSQIQNKLDSFEKKIPNTSCFNESKLLENSYNELERNYTDLKQAFENLLASFLRQQQEVISNKNKTNQLQNEIENLNQLKSIKPIQDIQGLQQEVQSISALTHNLKVNEQARTQDFLALYNVTVQSKQSITDLTKTTERNNVELNQHIKNQTSLCLQKVEAVNHTLNQTAGLLSGKIAELDRISKEQGNKITERVAVTACIDSLLGTKPSGYILKFPDIRSKVGISDTSSLASSGKFACEAGGLYLVSAWVLADTQNSEFAVFKNNQIFARAYITWEYTHPVTATAVVAVELQPGDKVWIQTTQTSYIWNTQGLESCLTILKVK